MNNILKFTMIGVTLISIWTSSAYAVEQRNPVKTDQIRISYVPPEEAKHQEAYEFLKRRQVLERLQKFLSPFKLEWVLNITLTECDGEADAMYAEDEITICYEYIEDLRRKMPEQTTPAGIEPVDVLIGPFVDTVLHEFAHALFDYADIPILGREEDAADQVAAYIYLRLHKSEARRLMMGTVYSYLAESRDSPPPTLADFAGEHSTSEQRAFNLLCMAYGSDPTMFEDIATKGGLTKQRAEYCGEEFELIALAFEALIEPHMDLDLAEIVYKQYFISDDTNELLIRRR